MQKDWLTMPERIVGLYVNAGHTRESFATAINTPLEVVRQWEQFEDVPSLIELGELANVLHVSKRFLCFGQDAQVPNRGEPALTDDGIRALLLEAGASTDEVQVLDRYQKRMPNEHYSRTFVLTFVRTVRAALLSGADPEIAMARGMVVATQAHVLSRAVAQGIRPVRDHQLTNPPKGLSDKARAEYIAAEIHKLSGIKPPIEATVLAVAMGHRLVPTLDTEASRVENDRQLQLDWRPTAQVDGSDLIINGLMKVTSWEYPEGTLRTDADAKTTNHVLAMAREAVARDYLQQVPNPAEASTFGCAFLMNSKRLTIARPTELGQKSQDWVRPALRDMARRMRATRIYVISDEIISVCAPQGPGQQRRTVIVDVEDKVASQTYVASTGADGTLQAWSEDRTHVRFRDLLP